jgi:hypothetical protein
MEKWFSDAALLRQAQRLAQAADDLLQSSIREDVAITLRLKLLRVKAAAFRYENEMERLIVLANS